MSTVYKLPYTGNEIKEKIGQVDKNTTAIGQLSEQLLNKINELRSPFSLLKNEDNSLTLVYKETTEE